MKKLPKKISVLGQVYSLKLVEGLMERDQLEGYVSPHEYLICVDKSLKGQVLRRVLLHELAHAYAFECGLHEFLSGQSLEMFCQTFSSLISHLFLTRNKRKTLDF